MRKKPRTFAVLAATSMGLVGGVLQASGPVAAMPATDESRAVHHGVCHGVHDCTVVGRFDVNGNGREDRVGLVNHDRDGYIRKGRVTVRVKTDRGRLVKQRVVVNNWRGAVWHGKAVLDGRRGREIVIGGDRDKYTMEGPGEPRSFAKGFHVLTFKPGSDLAKASSPDNRRLWWLTSPDGVRSGGDSAVFYHEWGWWRQRVDGRVRMQKRWLSTGGAAGVRSKKTVWVWRDGQWRHRSSRPMSDPLDRRYGGWHARGLPVW
jgi:hypothetical protein